MFVPLRHVQPNLMVVGKVEVERLIGASLWSNVIKNFTAVIYEFSL